jgi:iron(III) transport system ATP-binding protein
VRQLRCRNQILPVKVPIVFLSLRNVTKRFGSVTAVQNVSLDIEEAEFICFLGPSGCGKTTLLRIIAGLETPDESMVLHNGESLDGVPARLRNFGVVFQSYSLFPNMTVAKNVAYGLECHRWRRDAIDRRVREMLALVHLEDQAGKYPHQLSGGQQQRVAVARALAPEPDVLLLDEPLSALDAKVREDLRGEIRDLQTALSITTIMVTHDQDEAMEMADRIVVMNHGVIEQIGTARELYNRPINRFVAEFIGRMNVLHLAIGPDRMPMLADTTLHGVNVGALGPWTVGIRPEHIEVVPESSNDANHFTGKIERAVFLGNMTRITLDVGGQKLLVELRTPSQKLARGGSLTVRIPPGAVRALGRAEI